MDGVRFWVVKSDGDYFLFSYFVIAFPTILRMELVFFHLKCSLFAFVVKSYFLHTSCITTEMCLSKVDHLSLTYRHYYLLKPANCDTWFWVNDDDQTGLAGFKWEKGAEG